MSRPTSVVKLPKLFTFVFVASIVYCTLGSVYADSVGGPGGTWPKSWPKELEPLRKQASTWVGGEVMNTRYEIPFVNRDKFESAWPHILKLKSNGASITLLSGSKIPDEDTSQFIGGVSQLNKTPQTPAKKPWRDGNGCVELVHSMFPSRPALHLSLAHALDRT